jgi:hypothetical protein
LELLHNFTISTAPTLSTAPHAGDVWRVLVPQIGFTTKYIMDSILALSALHMARFNPSRRELLLSRAAFYHTSSLQEAMPLIPSVSSENCTNLFIFGVLTLFISVAGPRKETDMFVVGNGVIPEWLFLLRGLEALVQADKESLFSSPASAIFRIVSVDCELQSFDVLPEHKGLDGLESRIRSSEIEDVDNHQALLDALRILRHSFMLVESEPRDDLKIRGIYRWLFEISDRYLKMLRDRDDKAMCILAFAAVLLQTFAKFWWIEGWAVHLVARIYDALDDAYRLWIRWPMEEIGWVPECRFV